MKFDSFPLYSNRFRASTALQNLTICEFGCYCWILITSWIQSRPCYIQNNDEYLAKVCFVSMEQWLQVKDKVLAEFEVEGDYIYNSVLLDIYKEELKEAKKASKKETVQQTAILNYTWEQFWNDYDKKTGDQSRLIPKWMKLSDAERELIKAYIPKYKKAQPNKKFRKNPGTFLNNKTWYDELIDYTKNGSGQKTNSGGTESL